MKRLKKAVRKKNTYWGVLIVFIVLCLSIGVFCFQYYNKLQATIHDESSGYLTEISSRVGSNINRIIDDNYAVLNTVSSVLKNAEAKSFSDVASIVKTQQKYWKYQHMMLIDDSGRAYNSDGKLLSLNNDTYFNHVVVEKRQGVSTTQMIDNQECIMFVIPLEGMEIDGKNMIALASSYAPEVFDQTLSMSSFSGEAYSCIVNKSGIMMVRSSANTPLKTGYNVLTTIGEARIESEESIEQIKNNLAKNIDGHVHFTQDGVSYYMVYTSINTQDWSLLTFVPMSVVNEKSNLLLRITFLLCGLITLAFAGLVAVLMYSSYRNKRKLEQIAYVDEVTGGHTIQKFYELASANLQAAERPQYALVYSNIQKFKVLNEQFGRRTGDNILKAFHQSLTETLKNKECIGRISADNFCFLIEYQGEDFLLEWFEYWYSRVEEYIKVNKPSWSLPVTEFGVYVIENDSIPFSQMIDRAKLALRESPHNINSKLRYATYNDEVRRSLFREKQLEDAMEQAMEDGEFQLYLQPKYRTADETIGGAEALARWVSEAEGMIFPDEFIPLFEKNGFITKLDLWIFEEVCRCLRKWIDQGYRPVKVSVNCSRVHLKNSRFLEPYIELVQKYAVPCELIEIELTESIVMGDVERLSKIIDEIHDAGFGCSMDDFGSGYSSLNLIQSIPVDTLKLDKIFFCSNAKSPERMESVVGGIVGMAKALSMVTVAEGVEYEEQVTMLRKVGCDYIQGYIFARPMPAQEFEKLAFGDMDQ